MDLDKWKRPSLPAIDSSNDSIIFQQLDVDHYIDSTPMLNMPAPEGGVAPILRMYGLTSEGHSIVCHVHGFLPYFYVHAIRGFKVILTSKCTVLLVLFLSRYFLKTTVKIIFLIFSG